MKDAKEGLRIAARGRVACRDCGALHDIVDVVKELSGELYAQLNLGIRPETREEALADAQCIRCMRASGRAPMMALSTGLRILGEDMPELPVPLAYEPAAQEPGPISAAERFKAGVRRRKTLAWLQAARARKPDIAPAALTSYGVRETVRTVSASVEYACRADKGSDAFAFHYESRSIERRVEVVHVHGLSCPEKGGPGGISVYRRPEAVASGTPRFPMEAREIPTEPPVLPLPLQAIQRLISDWEEALEQEAASASAGLIWERIALAEKDRDLEADAREAFDASVTGRDRLEAIDAEILVRALAEDLPKKPRKKRRRRRRRKRKPQARSSNEAQA